MASPGLDGCHQAMCDFVLVPVLLGLTMVELALFFIFLTLTGGSQFSGRCYFSVRATGRASGQSWTVRREDVLTERVLVPMLELQLQIHMYKEHVSYVKY